MAQRGETPSLRSVDDARDQRPGGLGFISPFTGVPAGGLGFITPFTGVGLHAFVAGWPPGAAARDAEVG